MNNTRLPGPCPELFCLRRYLHILHTYGVRRGLEGALRSPCSLEGFERFAPFRAYRRGAPGAEHVALCLRKPRRRETEREARGPPRTWTAYTRMRCGATRDLAALRTAYRQATRFKPEGAGPSRRDGSAGTARHGDEGERIRRGRELRPLPALAICVLLHRVEDAKGHSAGHSKASRIGA